MPSNLGRLDPNLDEMFSPQLASRAFAAPGKGGPAPLLFSVTLRGMDDSPEIYENMTKALAILTAWNESGDGDLSLSRRPRWGTSRATLTPTPR